MNSQQFHNHINQVNITDSAPRLCDKGCGFYGSMAIPDLWLCSQCYRKHCITQPPLILDFGKLSINESSSSISSISSSSSATGTDVRSTSDGCTDKNRCSSCRKRVGFIGFKCRCGNTFCSVHRYAEEHGCTFDYRGTARNELSKANPCVKANKLQRI